MATIVLVHGAWVNSLSWEGFAARYRAAGHEVVAPDWPYDDRSPEELRASPDPRLAGVGVREIVDHFEAVVRALPAPPLLIGHSFGGLFVQMLLDRGCGAAGVAIDSAPPRGVNPSLDAFKAGWPVVSTWRFGSRVHTMSFADFQWGWVHTLPEAEQRAFYDRYVVPTPGRPYAQGAFSLFDDATAVRFDNATRAPLLLVAGELDRTVSASMNQSNFAKYAKSPAVTEIRVLPGRTHGLCFAPGWEEVADLALDWATSHARPPA